MTSSNQYYKMWMSGYRNMKGGRGSQAENFKAMAVPMIILPSLFTWVSNGFEWDDEDQVISFFHFPFGGLMFLGNLWVDNLNAIVGKDYGKISLSIFSPFNDMKDVMNKIGKKALTEDVWTGEEFLNSMVKLAKAVTLITGMPFQQIKRIVTGTEEIMEEGVDWLAPKRLIY